MSERMPVVFASHGAPDALLKAKDTVECWREIGESIPRPSAILAVSAHWEESQPTVSLASHPETIHDFHGFSQELYGLKYPAKGAPAIAERAASLISSKGMTPGYHPDRGLDHGAWVPLYAMYPNADVPVFQLSLAKNKGPEFHLELGRALTPIRDEGVLIVCSGAITHNFAWLDWSEKPMSSPHAEAFSDWLGERLTKEDIEALLDYRSSPYGAASHPSEDHILPLFAALGAAGAGAPRRYRPSYTYGALSMDAYVWRN